MAGRKPKQPDDDYARPVPCRSPSSWPSREDVAAAIDVLAVKLIAFEIGMLGLGKLEQTKLQNALELAGVEFDPAGGVKLKDHAA
jgi:hypothetical protein